MQLLHKAYNVQVHRDVFSVAVDRYFDIWTNVWCEISIKLSHDIAVDDVYARNVCDD